MHAFHEYARVHLAVYRLSLYLHAQGEHTIGFLASVFSKLDAESEFNLSKRATKKDRHRWCVDEACVELFEARMHTHTCNVSVNVLHIAAIIIYIYINICLFSPDWFVNVCQYCLLGIQLVCFAQLCTSLLAKSGVTWDRW